MSPSELTKVRDTLARALSVDAVNQLGRDTGQAVRLRTVTPHRLCLAVVSALAGGHVESLADLLRAFNYHTGVPVAYKAFYNRLARVGFALFMCGMCARLIERLRLHKFETANPHIAEGLIWASLCAAILKRFLAHAAQRVGSGVAVSTRRVAMCAWHILEELVRALLRGVGLRGALRRGLTYLLANARRANVPREHRTGRLRAGLELVTPA